MLKKIHSNREPGVTLWTEIHREFATYFEKAGTRLAVSLERCPRFGFALMIVMLLVSAALSFTVFRRPPPEREVHKSKLPVTAPIRAGIDQLLTATSAIRESVRLKHFIDSIVTKQTLSPTDSVALDTALSRLERLEKPFTHH